MRPSVEDLALLAVDTPGLTGDLRSDHAGETGAVMIYRGVLAVSRDPSLRAFALHHLRTEERHLSLLEDLLAPAARSALLPLWRVAGFLTGALPALAGPRAVYATIESVETFVVRHYDAQIGKLESVGPGGLLRKALLDCQADEAAHRDEARRHQAAPAGALLRSWVWMVGFGSAAAVAAARRI